MNTNTPPKPKGEIVYGGTRVVIDDLKRGIIKTLRVVYTDAIGPDGRPVDEEVFADVTNRVIAENQAPELEGYAFDPLKR